MKIDTKGRSVQLARISACKTVDQGGKNKKSKHTKIAAKLLKKQ